MSTQTQNIENSDSGIMCPKCHKTLKAQKILKLHISRSHPIVNLTPLQANNHSNAIKHPNESRNSLSPLEEGFGTPFMVSRDQDNLWYRRWKHICTLSGKQYDLPNGSTPKAFIHTLAEEIEALSRNEYPSKRLVISISVILQRNPILKQTKDIRTLLSQRLQSWKYGKYDFLINEPLS